MELHPGWEFRLWRDADLTWLRNQSIFDRATVPAQRADIARYEILHRFGGVYLDTDMEPLRSVDPLLENATLFGGRESEHVVAIGVLGAVPRHPLLGDVIDALPASAWAFRSLGVHWQTGPRLFTRILSRPEWRRDSSIRIYPVETFYPYGLNESFDEARTSRRTYAVHHWNASWHGSTGVDVAATALLPRDVGDISQSFALAASGVAVRTRAMLRMRVRSPVVQAAKRGAMRVSRLMETPSPVAWGADRVLARTPFDTLMLLPTSDLSLAPELAMRGTYEAPFVSYMSEVLRSGMLFVDVGANVGFFTVLGARLVGPAGRVIAYECSPEALRILYDNISLNWISDRVDVIPRAAHLDSTPRKLVFPEGMLGLGSIENRRPVNSASPRNVQEFEVECVSLSELVALGRVIDLLKIDVEGGEPYVLEGAEDLFEKGLVNTVVLEYRRDVLGREDRARLEDWFRQAQERWGVWFEDVAERRRLTLRNVLDRAMFSNLLVHFPASTRT